MRAQRQGFISKFSSFCLWALVITHFFFASCRVPKPEGKETISYKFQDTSAFNAAFLIMDGVYNTELTAGFDVFHHTIFRDNIKAIRVFTVAQTKEEVLSFEGLRIQPDFSFLQKDLPRIDLLIIPSAEHHLDTDLENELMIDWVKMTSSECDYVLSHCDGAFVLAQAGLLDQRQSTTFPGDINLMRQRFPSLSIHDSVYFVHDGKFITSSGGAKTFEASLYLMEYLYGKKVADEIAEGLVIDWNLDSVPYIFVENTATQ